MIGKEKQTTPVKYGQQSGKVRKGLEKERLAGILDCISPFNDYLVMLGTFFLLLLLPSIKRGQEPSCYLPNDLGQITSRYNKFCFWGSVSTVRLESQGSPSEAEAKTVM